jgi:hypothetical protein
LSKFIDVNLGHDLFEAAVSIPEAEYREVLYPVLDKPHASPYYFAFIGMVTALSGYYRHSGSTEIVDFVFDEQEGMQNRMLRMYGRFSGTVLIGSLAG